MSFLILVITICSSLGGGILIGYHIGQDKAKNTSSPTTFTPTPTDPTTADTKIDPIQSPVAIELLHNLK